MLLEGFPLDSEVTTLKEYKKNKVLSVSSPACGYQLLTCLDKSIDPESIREIGFRGNDVFACLDSALTDLSKLQLSDRCNLKVI